MPKPFAGQTPDPLIDAECARLTRKYTTWMYAADFAVEERCSVDTARRRLTAGDYGSPLDRLPGGGVRLLTAAYTARLRARQLIIKSS